MGSKSLYHIQFALHNKYPRIYGTMKTAFGAEDQWVAFNSSTYLVLTDKPFDDLRILIGINMANEIDDFMLMKLDYATAMSTFTDRHDILELLKTAKPELRAAHEKPSQDDIDILLDKWSDGLSADELDLLGRF